MIEAVIAMSALILGATISWVTWATKSLFNQKEELALIRQILENISSDCPIFYSEKQTQRTCHHRNSLINK